MLSIEKSEIVSRSYNINFSFKKPDILPTMGILRNQEWIIMVVILNLKELINHFLNNTVLI